MTTIQDVVDACVDALTDGLQPETMRRLATLMDQLTPASLGMQPGQLPPVLGRLPRGTIRTLSILEAAGVEVVVFCFPTDSRIPLHDHPGMTVLSKVLYGSLSVQSYDWATPLTASELRGLDTEQARQHSLGHAQSVSSATKLPPRTAVSRGGAVLTQDTPTVVLEPDVGNLHSFHATAVTSVLDVLMPPYNEDEGRDCHYFGRAADGKQPGAEASAVELRVIAPPPDLVIRRGEYVGPAVSLERHASRCSAQ